MCAKQQITTTIHNSLGTLRSSPSVLQDGSCPVKRQKLLKVSMLLALTLQTTAQALCTKYSYRTSAAPYSPYTVIVCAECMKLICSSVLILSTSGSTQLLNALRNIRSCIVTLMCPSFLYVIQNNLVLESVRLLTPTVYMACSQSKILTSALFGRLLLKTRVTRTQILALVLLVCGMFLVQLERDKSMTIGHPPLSAISPRGLVYVFTAACMSGFSGAYLEKIFKKSGTECKEHNIWCTNLRLSCISIPTAFFAAIFCDSGSISSQGFFYGYDGVVIAIVILQGLGGIFVAAVMRHASNVLKCFSVSWSICNCALAAPYLFEGHRSLTSCQVAGIIFVIGATFMYMKRI